MRVLLTNNTLRYRAGSELYIYDVAVELLKRGHEPIVFSTVMGEVGELLRAATVPVVDDLARVAVTPDIIHGQHHFDTLIAALTFPAVPALSFCHGWTPWEEEPLLFPSVVGYVAVDHVCRDRLIFEHGIPPDKIQVLLNFVDTERYRPRPDLPAEPRRALAFGHPFRHDGSLAILREACGEAGIELDAAGSETGSVLEKPENELGRYDLVFAKARSALEAMAVGCAVILCGPRGLGPMVTPEEWDRLRVLNFGVRTLALPLDVATVLSQIRRYNPACAAAVSSRVRSEATLSGAVDRLIDLYQGVLKRFSGSSFDARGSQLAAAQYLQSHALALKGRAADVLAVVAAKEHESENARIEAEAALAQERRARSDAENAREQAMSARLQAEAALAQEKHARLDAETVRDQAINGQLQAEHALAQERATRADAETARAQAENVRAQVETTLSRERTAHANTAAALVQANNTLASTQHELADLRNSATWRITRAVLENPWLRFLRPVWKRMGYYLRRKGVL